MSAAPKQQQPVSGALTDSSSLRELLVTLLSFAKWASVGSGIMLATFALSESDPMTTMAWAGLACFLALLARILQAEESQLRERV